MHSTYTFNEKEDRHELTVTFTAYNKEYSRAMFIRPQQVSENPYLTFERIAELITQIGKDMNVKRI